MYKQGEGGGLKNSDLALPEGSIAKRKGVKVMMMRYCRRARREIGLMRHVCLAFMLVGDDGLCRVEQWDESTRFIDSDS